MDRGLTLYSDPSERRASATARTPGEARPIRVGGKQQQSKLITKVNPLYPTAAKKAGIQGKVTLEAVISSDGTPKDVEVLSSPSEDLSQSALEAVRQWRYTSKLLNGNPVDVVTEIIVNYTLMP